MSMALYYNVLIPCVLSFLCVSTVKSVYFNVSGPDNKNIRLDGASFYSILGNIELTNPNTKICAGLATFTQPVPLWHSGNLYDFTTHFTFSINGQHDYHGEGIAFFLAPFGFAIPPNAQPEHLGLFNDTTYNSTSLNQIIAVEFDTHYWEEKWDPQFDHVGIDHNSSISAVNTTWNFTLGETYQSWITYNSTTKNLSVYWSYENDTNIRGDSLLSYQVDLKEVLPKNDCEFEKGAGPKSFSYKNLVSATNNFCQERKLGEGGYGGVYQGMLNDTDQPVAVKKFSRGSSQGTKEYITEVKIISRLRHRNLLQLIGWCHEKKELILVYELMPNGSLDSYLFGKRGPLVWAIRYKIALGLASALLYLHEEWEQCVLRRGIKSSNVMLDSSFNAKLGDFG